MKLKYIFAVGVMALLPSCDETRYLDVYKRQVMKWEFFLPLYS